MATQVIVSGPTQWDIMLGFFEGGNVRFSLDDGTTIEVDGIDAMWNMQTYSPLDDAVDPEGASSSSEGYLLRGHVKSADEEAFIEYRPRLRRGLCSTVTLGECETAFLPRIWSEVMGLDNQYTK